jgi:hypothetical protein
MTPLTENSMLAPSHRRVAPFSDMQLPHSRTPLQLLMCLVGWLLGTLMLATAVSATSLAAAATDRRNWFDDPFFALSSDIPGCPLPLGPLVTETEALAQTHHRLERGTRCHLEGRCRHPSSFDYDREIAADIRVNAKRIAPRPSTLWILVQGRRVWAYGCVAATYRRGDIERAIRRIADVELAMEEVRVGARGSVPYTLAAPRADGSAP